jgi:NCS1 family nucleobase:cation symporter-1
MILGAVVGLAAPKGNLVTGLGALTQGIAPLVLISFSLGIASANAMSLYCAALSALTFGQTLIPKWSPGSRARITISLVLFGASVAGALSSKESFLANYENFISILLYVLVPWTAINLVDYYLLRRGQYDVASFFRQDGGIYGRINAAAVICYGVGILVQVPFIAAAPLYTGIVAKRLDGCDLSWIVGLAVTSPAYYWLAKRSRAHAKGSMAQYAPGDAQS